MGAGLAMARRARHGVFALALFACGGSDGPAAGAPDSGVGGNVPGGGEDRCVPEREQSSCVRQVPESVAKSIACTPKSAASGYDGCTANTPCGAVTGCPLERCDTPDGVVDATYTPPNPAFTPPPMSLPPVGTELHGHATAWFARGDGTLNTGSCGFVPVRNLTGVALATRNFGEADFCGACAEVVATSGKRVRVQIVDQCVGCKEYGLDIPQGVDAPYTMLDDPSIPNTYQCPGYDGSIPITWRIVPCETNGGLRVSYLEGYNKWTPAVRLSNHRLSIAQVEEQFDGKWSVLPRKGDNKYVLAPRTGDTTVPITLRVTAVDGATITATFPTFVERKLVEARAQF